MSSTRFSVALLTVLGSIFSASAVFPPPLPVINTANVFNVTSYGAVGDGVTNNATAIQAAITAAAGASGGGTVEIPAAAQPYLSGPVTFASKVNLQIDSGAILMMLPRTNWPGTTAFINGSSLTDCEISGLGTIDGNAHFGSSDWWGPTNGSPVSSRPNFINFSSTTRILIQDVTLQNPPTFHLMLKGNNKSITIQRININTPYPSPNTDGMDLGSTNILVRDCHITDGDDNIEIGGNSALVADLTVTNCIFGHGHGVSVGSDLKAGVSNVTVINCIFTNTDYGIRMKSDDDRGGVIQGMNYYNLGMTNITFAPILIYSYYNTHGSPSNDGITPQIAATQAVASVTTTNPVYRNIVISNLTATAAQPCMIWARMETPASDITLNKLNITATDSANGSVQFYSVHGVQVVDCQFHLPNGSQTFQLFNAGVTFTNSTTGASAVSLNGFAVTNALNFYNQSASFSDTNVFGATPISLGGSTLSDATLLTLAGTTPVNFKLGTNVSQVAVTGSLTLNDTLNITNGGGFGTGTYTLFTYTGSFSGSATLGSTPAGYNYALTNGAGKVNLVVTTPCVKPGATVSGGGTICSGGSVNIQAALTGTPPWIVTWSDGSVQSGVVASPAIRSVSPAVTTIYTITNISDSTGCAAGSLTGSATATVLAHPTASVSGGGIICGGASTNIQAALTGSAPWTVMWSDGVTQSGVSSSPAIRSVSPVATTIYTVTNLADSTGCSAGSLSGSALVTVCQAGPFEITSAMLQGVDHFVIIWSSVSNEVYLVISGDSLDPSGWITNATITATSSSTSWTNSGVSSIPQHFFRVVNTQ